MSAVEKRIWALLIRHRMKIFLICVTLLSMYARFRLRNLISPDMKLFLLPWYDEIQEKGGLKALSAQIGNYQISYQTMIALMTYLPIDKVYAYKIISVIFDYTMSTSAGLLVWKITESKEKAAIAYAAVLISPVTILNSAAWGQCDSIFTFFLILTFLMLLQERYNAALFLYGMAFAFKLQAIFFLPFLLFYYIWSQKFSAWRFMIALLPILLFSCGGLMQGRSILDILQIYHAQSEQYRMISMNYPSFWNLIVEVSAGGEHSYYTELQVLCLATTMIVLGGLVLWSIRKEKMNNKALLMLATLMMYTCIFFLPAMHERYDYPVLIFTLMICAMNLRMIPVALGMLFIDMQTYGQYLMGKEIPSWEFLVLLNMIIYVLMVYMTRHAVYTDQNLTVKH